MKDGDAVQVLNQAGAVTNYGYIGGSTPDSGRYASGVVFYNVGGSVDNEVGGKIVVNGDKMNAVFSAKTATVTNSGSIKATGQTCNGVYLQSGSLTNGGSIEVSAAQGQAIGVEIASAGDVNNLAAGRITLSTPDHGFEANGHNGGSTVKVGDGGSVENAGYIGAFGYETNAVLLGKDGKLTNTGTVYAKGYYGVGMIVNDGGSVTNSGSITDNGLAAAAVYFLQNGRGTVDNQSGGVTDGIGGAGVATNTGAITVTNEKGGTIEGTGMGVLFGNAFNGTGGGGTVDNAGVITGPTGVLNSGGTLSVTNSGAITGTTASTGTTSKGVKFALGDGVFSSSGGTVANQTGGTIDGITDGVSFGAGGAVDNLGSIGSQGSNTLSGAGVSITGGAGTVTNSGSISTTTGAAANATAVYLGAGGSVTNQQGGLLNADGPKSGNAIIVEGAAATVVNAGSIDATGTNTGANGAVLFKGGSVDNQGTGHIGASALLDNGIYVTGGTGTVTNSGYIRADATGEFARGVFESSGSVTNSGTIIASAPDGKGFGVQVFNGASVSNLAGGKITAAGSDDTATAGGSLGPVTGFTAGVEDHGGAVDNQGYIGATGYDALGVLVDGGKLTNEGTVEVKGFFSIGVSTLNGDIVNSGTITDAGGLAAGVYFAAGGSLVNQAGATVSGVGPSTPQGAGAGVASAKTAISVINKQGATLHGGSTGVLLGHDLDNSGGGGTVGNYGGTISGASGIVNSGAGVAVTNSGAITGSAENSYSFNNIPFYSGDGVFSSGGGTVANQAGGTISGVRDGVEFQASGSVTNAGSITGGSDSVVFGGTGAHTLTLQTGSTLTGAALGSSAGGATNALMLQGTGTANNEFENFTSLDVQASGVWTLGGADSVAATTVASGTLDVTGALTGALTLNGGDVKFDGASANDVSFSSHGDETLTLGAAYTGVVSNFVTDDAIDLTQLAYAGAASGYSVAEVGTSDVYNVTVTEGSGSQTLQFFQSTPVTASEFVLSRDSGGGTILQAPGQSTYNARQLNIFLSAQDSATAAKIETALAGADLLPASGNPQSAVRLAVFTASTGGTVAVPNEAQAVVVVDPNGNAGAPLNVTIAASEGTPVIIGDGNINLTDVLDAELTIVGSGDDSLTVVSGANKLTAGSGRDTLFGGSGSDTLIGGGNTRLVAGSGNQTVTGGLAAGSHDTLVGGSGADLLQVSLGNNRLVGGAGHNTLTGGAGNDTLIGGGASSLVAGTGANRLVGGLSAGAMDTLTDGSGRSLLSVTMGQNSLVGGSGANTLRGGAGGDTLIGGGQSRLVATGGRTLMYSSSNAGGHDTLIGASGDDTLIALAGANRLLSGAGSDALIAGSGNDTLVAGGSGAVLMIGGTGFSRMVDTCGANASIFGASGGERVVLAATGNDSIFSGKGAMSISSLQNASDLTSNSSPVRGGAHMLIFNDGQTISIKDSDSNITIHFADGGTTIV